jgi:hypothetical protein
MRSGGIRVWLVFGIDAAPLPRSVLGLSDPLPVPEPCDSHRRRSIRKRTQRHACVFRFRCIYFVNLPSIRVQSVAPGPRVLPLSSGFAGPIEAFEPASIFGPMSATVHPTTVNGARMAQSAPVNNIKFAHI